VRLLRRTEARDRGGVVADAVTLNRTRSGREDVRFRHGLIRRPGPPDARGPPSSSAVPS
jgi:hypothetical protein